jgi:hypothetical protein
MQKLEIRNIRNDELFNPSFGGQYVNKNRKEKVALLTHPQAVTLRIMGELKTYDEQFEFYCYAYLRELMHHWLEMSESKAAFDVFTKLADKYGVPWIGSVRNTLPAIESWADHRIITKDGIDTQKLKEKFSKYFDYEFILY